ncbi:MAG TPA: carboxylesterase [Gammaproteobacteria bacterium]|nr:carboxylesterase [Gammaproteobacteria bacterium]
MSVELLERLEIDPPAPPHGSVIWLHGLGADGHDFEPLVRQWDLVGRHHIRFVLPHAPARPVTLNGGAVMRAWYDILDMEFDRQEDEAGIRQSARQLEALIAAELDRGVPPGRIVLAGFSQGGAIALHTGLRHARPLAGILGLSTYLPLAATLEAEMNPLQRATPVRMDHGEQDPLVPLALARRSAQRLESLGVPVEFHTYAMGHSLCPAQIDSLYGWLRQRLGRV